MKKEKKIQQLAEQIIQAEKIINSSLSLDETVQSAKKKIENIMESLTFLEMLEIDEYIMSKNLTE